MPCPPSRPGMRKRLALARTLLQDGGARAARRALRRAGSARVPPGRSPAGRAPRARATVLMATHLLDRGAALCDEGLVLEGGRLRWQGPARDLPARAGSIRPRARGPMTQLAAALRKEWLLQRRAFAPLLAVFVFGATALLLFSFAVGPNYELLRGNAAGFLWLGPAALLHPDPGRELPERDGASCARGPAPAARQPARPLLREGPGQLVPARCSSGIALVPLMVVLYDAGTAPAPRRSSGSSRWAPPASPRRARSTRP